MNPKLSKGAEKSVAELRPLQLAWLAAAVFVVSVGYGALLPLLPSWLDVLLPGATAAQVARHVGFLSAVYAAGVLIGAPLWGLASDKVGRSRILIIGLVGYVASLLLLLVPGFGGLWGIYALRGATGLFVAAVIPVVSALVAEHTPAEQRARRFAWLGAMSLLGFLFGPGLKVLADWFGSWVSAAAVGPVLSAQIVIVLSALLGTVMMLGLAATLPPSPTMKAPEAIQLLGSDADRPIALWLLSSVVMFVLAGFELGISLQGQQTGMSSRQVALMFAECSLVMLAINALLFFTSMLEKISPRVLIGTGLIMATIGLSVMAGFGSDAAMYSGVSLTSAGTGLVLPVISFLAAGAARQNLGATMGGLAAAAGVGQTLGSSIGGWLFGLLAQITFAWLTLPLIALLIFLLVHRVPRWEPHEPNASLK